MTCHHCRHSRKIAHLDEIPDEAEREAERARLRAICVKCQQGEQLPGDGRISLDAIIDGTADRLLDVAPNYAPAYTFDPGEIDGDKTEPEKATELPDADEEALRQLLITAVGLEPLQIVVALHAARRSDKTAAQAVRDFAADFRRYNGDENSRKATFHAKWQRILGEIPELTAIRAATERRGT